MKVLYIECNMGAAGDMLTGALSELLPDPERFLEIMNDAGIPGMRMRRVRKSSCGILGTHMAVEIHGEEELCPDVPEGAPEESRAQERACGQDRDHDHDYDHDYALDHEHAHPHDHDHAHDYALDHDHAHPHDRDPFLECEHALGHDHNLDHNLDLVHDLDHDHSPGHDHDLDHDHNLGHDHGLDSDHNLDLDHGLDSDHNLDLDHDHAHDHALDHGHAHSHDHGHAHSHDHGHAHSHANLAEVCAQIDALKLPGEVRAEAKAVYALLAEAEAHVHGCDAQSLHFHEVGMLDAITDVCAVCLAMHMLRPGRVVVSPIHTGFGQVRCAHGILPVPTPATAYLLRGLPASSGSIRGELLTPTGAALLKHFATEFGWMPSMRVEKIGCGMGTKEFPAANCVRAFWGEDAHGEACGSGETAPDADEVFELSCNLDDMTGEAIGFATEALISAGALDVYLTPIQMKKGRPGVKLSVLCRPEDRRRLEDEMLRHTTTLGLRAQRFERTVLPRHTRRVSTPYGELDVKIGQGESFTHSKVEYEDAARAARRAGVTLSEVQRAAEQALR